MERREGKGHLTRATNLITVLTNCLWIVSQMAKELWAREQCLSVRLSLVAAKFHESNHQSYAAAGRVDRSLCPLQYTAKGLKALRTELKVKPANRRLLIRPVPPTTTTLHHIFIWPQTSQESSARPITKSTHHALHWPGVSTMQSTQLLSFYFIFYLIIYHHQNNR